MTTARAGLLLSTAWSTPLAAWRLLRVLGHIFRGLWIVQFHLDRLDAAQRDEAILFWSRRLLKVLGIHLVVQGQPQTGAKLIVANHVSWLDIIAINSVVPSRFVSKAEVENWPLIGLLVTAAGTLYLRRERRRDAMRVLGLMSQSMRDGHTVAVFPEGTTGEGHGTLPFHANLLQAAIDAPAPVQPVVLRYSDQRHIVSPLAAYAGDTTLIGSLKQVATARGLTVHATVLPVHAVQHADRRVLAMELQHEIATALEAQSRGKKPHNGEISPLKQG